MTLLLPIIIGAAATAGVLLIGKSAEVSEFIDKVNYSVKVLSMKLKLDGTLDITLGITLMNPTKTELTFVHPFVILFKNGSEVGRGARKKQGNSKYNLKPYSNFPLPPTLFTVNTLNFLGDAGTILSELAPFLKKFDVAGAQAVIDKNYNQILKTLSVQVTTEINGVPLIIDETLAGGTALGYIALGYAPVSAIDRKIQDGSRFAKYFPQPKGEKKLIIRNGSVEQTVRAMIDIVNQDAYLIREASLQLFKRDTYTETAKAVFDWIFKYIKYNLEEGEQLRNPLMVYHLGQRLAYPFYQKNGYFNTEYTVDCDDISIFVASVLKNLNIPYLFRIASYKDVTGKDNGFSHVYTVIPLQNGQEIIIDPVYYAFDAQKIFNRKKDFFMNKKQLNGIDVYYLNGIDQPEQNAAYANAHRVLQGIDEHTTEQDMFDYLRASRAAIAKNPNALDVGIPAHEVIAMYDYALKYWNTPYRAKALKQLALIEAELKRQRLLGRTDVMFFGALEGKTWDKLKDFGKKAVDKGKEMIKGNYANKSAKSTVERSVDVSDNARSSAPDDGSKSAAKTMSALVSKYKIPISIGVGSLALAITYWLANRKSKAKSKRASKPVSRKLGAIKLS